VRRYGEDVDPRPDVKVSLNVSANARGNAHANARPDARPDARRPEPRSTSAHATTRARAAARRRTLAAAALALLALAAAPAPPRAATRAAVLTLLSGFEYSPSKDDLDRLGTGVETQLMSIAADPGAWLVARGRALALLGHYPTAPVLAFLEARLADGHAEYYVKRYAIAGLVRALGAADPARAFGAVRPLLADPDFRVREGAAFYLRDVRDKRVLGVLRTHLAAERHAAVKPAVVESIKVIEARGGL